jgi:beta-N-acetylhexosaminidase
MNETMRSAAGGELVVGLGGTELTALERAWLKLVRPAGIILFRRNIADAAQTRAMLNDAAALCTPHSLRCVDVEGGTVDRLRDALASLPSAQAVAKAHFAREHGALVGRAVKAFGFNTTLAPVLDLALPGSAAVMGTRAAAATPDDVVNYAHCFLDGLAGEGIAGCGKHFPGLGGGTQDSHLVTPEITRNEKEIRLEDLAPYRALRIKLPMVMVNHAAYPQTPGGTRPASVSPYWITTVLRRRVGYNGIVFSDDLEMGGILKYMPIEEAVVAAIRAGMDLMEICHSPELILRAYEALLAESERSKAFAAMLTARARRTAKLRSKLFANSSQRALTARQFEALRAQIIRFGAKVAEAQQACRQRP